MLPMGYGLWAVYRRAPDHVQDSYVGSAGNVALARDGTHVLRNFKVPVDTDPPPVYYYFDFNDRKSIFDDLEILEITKNTDDNLSNNVDSLFGDTSGISFPQSETLLSPFFHFQPLDHLPPLDILRLRNEDIDAALAPVIERLQEDLAALEGKQLESFTVKQTVAIRIQETVARLGLALACPKEGCGHPAKLRCIQPPRSEGVFQFDHVIDGKRTSHGAYVCVPPLKLIAAAPDRRKKPKPVTSEDSADS